MLKGHRFEHRAQRNSQTLTVSSLVSVCTCRWIRTQFKLQVRIRSLSLPHGVVNLHTFVVCSQGAMHVDKMIPAQQTVGLTGVL